MHELIAFLAFLILFIIVFFFCMNSLKTETNAENAALQPKDIGNSPYDGQMNAYVKFSHMIPNADNITLFVGDVRIFRNKSYGYVSPRFETVKSGRNEVKVYKRDKLIFSERMNFQPYQYDLYILYNLEKIFKTNSLNKIRVFNAIKSQNPLKITWKKGSNMAATRYSRTGEIYSFDLNQGLYDFTVKDQHNNTIIRQKIQVGSNKCKVYSIAGTLSEREQADSPSVFTINGSCGYLGNAPNENLIEKDLGEMGFGDNAGFFDGENDLIAGDEWDNEVNDISDLNGDE